MKPSYFDNFSAYYDAYEVLRAQVPWVNRDAPRDECFMGSEPNMEYTYGKFARTYTSVPLHEIVQAVMAQLNNGGSRYNVCFLNYYKDERQHLGWHSDDSPEMDLAHPIAVVSFGAERGIWVRPIGATGVVPQEDRYVLRNNSLFVMPAGFQAAFQHRIPKNDKPCGGRISLTYRRFQSA